MKKHMSIRTGSRSAQRGFSLAELMVVIVIIGLIATIVTRNVFKSLSGANLQKAKSDIMAIYSAAESYAIEHGGKFPESLEVLLEKDASGQAYLEYKQVPPDPWKNQYQYNPPSGGQDLELFSFGKDGQPGGEGEDRDIRYEDIKNQEI